MNPPRPSCVLLLGARGGVADRAEAFAREHLEIRHVSRYAREAKTLAPEVASTFAAGPVDILLNYLSPVRVPSDLLTLPRLGAINFHPAPPRWPGVGGASYALFAGDSEYGATAHRMTDVFDAGSIIRVDRFAIQPSDDCDDLFDHAIERTLSLFESIVEELASGRDPVPSGDQWERKSGTRREFDAWLTLAPTDPADVVARKVRAARSRRFPGPYVGLGGERFALAPITEPKRVSRSGIPWWEPQMTGEELERIREVIDQNYLNEGAVTERFELALAAHSGARHAVCVTSGTTALALALMAVEVRSGDEVIIPDLTFIASANAVMLAGGTPVLVDIDPRTLCLDPTAVEAAITRRTRAIMPVHVSGRGADMGALTDIARRHGVAIVEDAAEAFQSRQNGRALGTIGRAGCLSFSPNKTITTGQGGAVLTNDDDIAARLRTLKDHGRPVRGTGGDDIHPTLGFNFKLTNLQAAVGLAQLAKLDWRVGRQRRIQELYREGLVGLAGIELLPFDLANDEIPLWTDALVERRDRLDRHLSDQAMGCRRFWFPLHTQEPYRQPDAKFPSATRVAPHALWLPSAFTLTDDEVRAVCAQIHVVLK